MKVLIQAVSTLPGVAYKAKYKVVLPHTLNIVHCQLCIIPVEVQNHATACVEATCSFVVALSQLIDYAGAGSFGTAYVDILVPATLARCHLAVVR